MTLPIKKYFWSAMAGLAMYLLLLLEMNRALHCLTNKDFMPLFSFPLGKPGFHVSWAFYMMWIYPGIGLFFFWRRYQ